MNDKKSNLSIPLLFAAAVVLGMFAGYKLHSNMPMSRNIMGTSQPFAIDEIMQLIKERYVDKISLDTVEQTAINGMLETLDPHSAYISPREITGVNEELEGQFQGIGIEFNIFNDTVHVLSVMKDGPAYRSGLQVGDKVIAVSGKKTTPIQDADEFKKMVKGPAGTEIEITLYRGGAQQKRTIRRGHIPVTAIDAYYMVDKEKGYIRLNRFSSNTYKEFMDALEDLKKKGMQKLVLDLRDNGGGILDQSVDIIDEFIGGDQLLVYTEGAHHPRKEYRSRRQGAFEDQPLVVLINEGSASASEIIAGALQDLERATIIGRRSFGKGLVQEQYYLSDGAALRLTTARYYTPLGRSIQKPYGEGKAKYDMELVNRLHAKKDAADSAEMAKRPKFKTRSGKILYGGGGITPDVPQPMGLSLLDTSVLALYLNNTLANFAYRQFIFHQKKISAFRSIQDYQKDFDVNDDMIAQLLVFAKEQKVNISGIPASSRPMLKVRIKALMARYQWNENGYHQIINNSDNTFSIAVERLNQD